MASPIPGVPHLWGPESRGSHIRGIPCHWGSASVGFPQPWGPTSIGVPHPRGHTCLPDPWGGTRGLGLWWPLPLPGVPPPLSPPVLPPPKTNPTEQRGDPLQSLRLHPGAAAEQPSPLRGAAGPGPAPDGQRGLTAAGECRGGAGVCLRIGTGPHSLTAPNRVRWRS